MIFPHAVENRKIRGICPCPAIREGGHARRGTSRQRAHKPRLRAPHCWIPPLLTLPQHIYYSTFRPKRKGFSFIIIVFCGGWGKNVVFGQSGCVRFCRETVQAAWGSFPVTIKTKPHGCAMRRGRGGDRRRSSVYIAPSSLPQERNPLRNKKMQLVLTPKSNEIKRNQMKSNFLDEHPFSVLQYHCRNSGE